MTDVVAKPFIVMRNDHQDALSAGLAVTEYAPTSKSAEEINGLWQWVEAKLNGEFAVRHEVLASNLPEAPLAPLFNEPSAETTAIVS
jgi:chromosome partitioning protein